MSSHEPVQSETAEKQTTIAWPSWFHWRIGRDLLVLLLLGFSAVGAVIGASTGIASLNTVNRVRSNTDLVLDGTPEQFAKIAGNNPANPHLTLVSEDRNRFLDVVIGEDRTQGWSLGTNLSGAGQDANYQLWVKVDRATYPVAYPGKRVVNVYFSMPKGATSIFVTEEKHPVLQPEGRVVVTGNIPAKEL